MKIEWLKKIITPEEAEEEHMVSDERLGSKPVPFGFQNSEWKRLFSQMKEGDELWEFCSPNESWIHLTGRSGIALVRDGRIIESITTMMN